MFTFSLKPRRIAAAVLFASASAALAAPVVVDFESAPPLTVVGPTQPDTSYLESGVRFTPSGSDAVVDMSFCALGSDSCISNNAGVYLTALNGAEVTITAERWIGLNSFDASFFPLPTPAGLFAGMNFGLKLTGTLWGGGTVEQTVALVEDVNIPGDFLFSSYTGDSSMTVLSSLTLSACYFETASSCVRSGAAFAAAGLLFNDMQFAIDNLSLSIPEPSAAWLVVLGLMGAAATRRRSAV